MSDIADYLSQIANAVKGKDVRSAIVNAIETCYNDGHAGATDLTARQKINEVKEDLNDTNSMITDLNAEVNAIESCFNFKYIETHSVNSLKTNVYRMGNMVYLDVHIQLTGSNDGSNPIMVLSDDVPEPVVDAVCHTDKGIVFVKKGNMGVYVAGPGGAYECALIFLSKQKSDDVIFKRRIVEELPEEGIENCVYFVLVDENSDDNKYEEWVWIEGAWERLGGGNKSRLPVLHAYATENVTDTVSGE